jgi:hypothetical protein
MHENQSRSYVWHACRHRSFMSAPALLVAGLLLAAALLDTATGAQTPSTLGRANTWAARSSSGLTLAGTWTAAEDRNSGAVTGTWTLNDAQGRVVANGGWSAAKVPSGWSGSWRAIAVGRAGEYSGTWTAGVELGPTAKFADLFAKAADAVITGTWQSTGQTGAWTIRAFK